MLGNADKHAPVLSILCCARRIHVIVEQVCRKKVPNPNVLLLVPGS